MKKTLVLFILTLGMAFGLQAQTNDYTEKVKSFLVLSGAEENFKMVIEQMLNTFKASQPDVPEEYWSEVKKEVLNTSLDDLVNLIAPIYQKHLTEADLDDIIEFYKTPAGKKLAEKTPVITQESMAAGQQWGMQIAQKVQAKLKEKGY